MSAPQGRAGAVELFLQRVLVDGAVAVDALEVKARAAGLLGQHQQIGASKAFRRAKKGLRIRSVRAGFGRDGRWSWALPTASETASADHPPEVPTSVAYAENHSRPVRSGNADQTTSTGVLSAPIEPTQTGRVPLEWLAGVASLGRLQAPAGIPPT